MDYESTLKQFFKYPDTFQQLFNEKIKSPSTLHFDLKVGSFSSFFYYSYPIYEKVFSVYQKSIKLNEIYNLGNLGTQIAVMSEKAFTRIKYLKSIESEPIYREKYYTRKNQADIRFEEIRIEELNSDKPKIEDLMKRYD